MGKVDRMKKPMDPNNDWMRYVEISAQWHKYREERIAKLAPYNLLIPEYYMLRILEDGARSRESIAVRAYEEYGGDILIRHCESYLVLVNGLLERNVLKRLSLCDETARQDVIENEAIPSCDDSQQSSGYIDYSKDGYALYRTMSRALHGLPSGMRWTEDVLQAEVYSEDRGTCEDQAKRLISLGEEHIVDEKGQPIIRRVEKVTEPMAVGPWRLSRHEVVPCGYCIRISYVETPE